VSRSVGIGLVGLGRIGRGIVRELAKAGWPVRVNAIAEINPRGRPEPEMVANLAYLLEFDSTYGRFPGRVEADGTRLILDGTPAKVFFSPDPAQVDWRARGCEIVVEASGDERVGAAAARLVDQGLKVLITRSAAHADIVLIRGFNWNAYDPARHRVVACGSCTLNAAAPVVKLVERHWGVEELNALSVHPALSADRLLDAPAGEFAEGRGAWAIRPVRSGLAHGLQLLMPELKGKVSAMTMRVPTQVVNALVLVFNLRRPPASVSEVMERFEEASREELAGVVEVNRGRYGQGLVSVDFTGAEASAIVDRLWCDLRGRMLRMVVWHDNEAGYCRRVVESIGLVAGA